MNHLVFVYGTLRQGDCRGFFFKDNPELTEAYLPGYDLFDLGAFPGIRPGQGRVRGEIHRIDQAGIESLDRIEGYQRECPEGSLYLRRRVQAESPAGETIKVWVYIFNNPHNRDLGPAIPSGDWFEHKGLY